MIRNRIIRAVLPREAVPLLEDLMAYTGWEPGRIIAHGLAELAARLLAARQHVAEVREEGSWH